MYMRKIMWVLMGIVLSFFIYSFANASLNSYPTNYEAVPVDFSSYYCIYKNDQQVLTDINNGLLLDADLRGNTVSFSLNHERTENCIYNLNTGKKIINGVFPQANLAGEGFDGSYKNYSEFYEDKSGKWGVINIETGDIVIQPQYKKIYEFYNDYAIAEKADGSYSVLNIKGNETKKLNLNPEWKIVHAKGTNIICTDKLYNYFLYRGYAEIKSDVYEEIRFCDNQMLCRKDNSYYILNADCTLLKSFSGYNIFCYLGNGFYEGDKVDGDRADIINNRGEILIGNIYNSIEVYDEGYILCLKTDDLPCIFIYDFSGKLLGGHIFNDFDVDEYSQFGYSDGKVYVDGVSKATKEHHRLYFNTEGNLLKEMSGL